MDKENNNSLNKIFEQNYSRTCDYSNPGLGSPEVVVILHFFKVHYTVEYFVRIRPSAAVVVLSNALCRTSQITIEYSAKVKSNLDESRTS